MYGQRFVCAPQVSIMVKARQAASSHRGQGAIISAAQDSPLKFKRPARRAASPEGEAIPAPFDVMSDVSEEVGYSPTSAAPSVCVISSPQESSPRDACRGKQGSAPKRGARASVSVSRTNSHASNSERDDFDDDDCMGDVGGSPPRRRTSEEVMRAKAAEYARKPPPTIFSVATPPEKKESPSKFD